jgi:hypothetical protein
MAENSEFEGSKKVTCKKANELLLQGKVRKVWFRPDKLISPTEPDEDDAYIWYLEDEGAKKK